MTILARAFRLFSSHQSRYALQSLRMASLVTVSDSGVEGVRILTLNRPPVNSLNVDLINEFVSNLNRFSGDSSLQGVIIKSSSPKVFCAGLDLNFVLNADQEGMTDLGRALHDLWRSIYASRLAVFSAINGPALAGGFLIASACDYRIINETASVGLTESQLGVVAPWYLRETVVRLIGAKEAERMFVLGRVYKAPEALKLGMVDEIVGKDGDLDARCVQVMKHWINIPESGRAGSKLELRKEVIEYADTHRKKIEDWFVNGLLSQSTRESVRSYFQGLQKKSKM